MPPLPFWSFIDPLINLISHPCLELPESWFKREPPPTCQRPYLNSLVAIYHCWLIPGSWSQPCLSSLTQCYSHSAPLRPCPGKRCPVPRHALPSLTILAFPSFLLVPPWPSFFFFCCCLFSSQKYFLGDALWNILQARTLEWVAISFSNAWKWKVKVVSQSCPSLGDPMDCSPPGSSVHGLFQARVLEWGAIAFSFMEYREYKI